MTKKSVWTILFYIKIPRGIQIVVVLLYIRFNGVSLELHGNSFFSESIFGTTIQLSRGFRTNDTILGKKKHTLMLWIFFKECFVYEFCYYYYYYAASQSVYRIGLRVLHIYYK